MKKRISHRKKHVSSHKRAWHHKKHLRVHAIFVYTSATIFLFSIFAVVVHVFIKPIAQQNETYYASNKSTLGESENREGDAFGQEINQLEEEQKKTEKEMSELDGDKLYQKAVGRPTRAPEHSEFNKSEEVRRPELKKVDGPASHPKLEDKEREQKLVADMIATGVINELKSDGKGSTSGNVEFAVENDRPVYKIAGLKKFKFLGFIPVSQPITAIVSSETGEVIKTEKPFFTSFVDLLSP